MKFEIYKIHECQQAKGLCVVIDVLRAFTTAAFAFAAGAKEIIFVSTLEEAFQKFQQDNSLILMGELEGEVITGFHYGNSPASIETTSFRDQKIVHRTSAGTQGVVGCRHVPQMLVSSFVVAEATLKRIRALNPEHVSFIVTGFNAADEDLALAEYLIEHLKGNEVSIEPYLERVRNSSLGQAFLDPSTPDIWEKDLELAIQADRFGFAMEISKIDGDLIAKPVYP